MTTANEEGRRFGVYTGIVANVDDPEQRGRVQLRIPAILGQAVHGAWALPMGAHIGGGTGSLVVPDLGAVVMVQFLDGSPEVPLYQPAPWATGPREVQSNQRQPPNTNRYPRKRLWLRSHRGRGLSIVENELGDMTLETQRARLRVVNESGRIEFDVRGTSDGKVVFGEAQDDQYAARNGDRVKFGSLSVTMGPGGVAAVLWHPPDGSPPVTLSAVPTELSGAIDGGSHRVLIGND